MDNQYVIAKRTGQILNVLGPTYQDPAKMVRIPCALIVPAAWNEQQNGETHYMVIRPLVQEVQPATDEQTANAAQYDQDHPMYLDVHKGWGNGYEYKLVITPTGYAVLRFWSRSWGLIDAGRGRKVIGPAGKLEQQYEIGMGKWNGLDTLPTLLPKMYEQVEALVDAHNAKALNFKYFGHE